jgi:CBS domain-containing protein
VSAPDVEAFLRTHPPFDALAEADVERVAAAAEEEAYAQGATIFTQGSGPVEHLRVVRSGAVEIVHDGRVLDLLGPGELFGQASMLSGLPAGLTARAAEPTRCYRVPAEVARVPLGRPEALRFVTRSLLLAADAPPVRATGGRAVGGLLRAPLVICGPDTPIREVARRMTEAPATSAVVALDGGGLGILTDRDLRTRVIAAGIPVDAPVAAAMSAPAHTVGADRLGAEALVEMLDRGIRHLPVLSGAGAVLGVVEDADLLAAEARTSFHLRAAIARAADRAALAAVARELAAATAALQQARLGARQVMAIHSVVIEALVRRLVELALADAGPAPAAFSWLALGSLARREATPGSDVDSALAWSGGGDDDDDDDDEPTVRAYASVVAREVDAGLLACGLRPDARGATAADPLLARSVDAWHRAVTSWLEDPSQEGAPILVSVIVDSRPVWGDDAVAAGFVGARAHPALLRRLAQLALAYRPPTGFMRGLVVEHSGRHRGRLDLKHGGLVPIVDLARWAGMSAGVTSASTPERLRAAADAGTLPAADAATLADAFDLVCGLRLDHQAQQIAAGEEPDDHLDPAALSPLTRTYLKEAFRAVAAVQKRIGGELALGVL